MNFKPCSIEVFKKMSRRSDYKDLIERFRASGVECASVDDFTAGRNSVYAVLSCEAKKAGDVRCAMRNGRIYLVRVDALNEIEAAGAGQTDCVKP